MPSYATKPKLLLVVVPITEALGFGLSTLAVAMRVYTKARIVKSMRSEDCRMQKISYALYK